MRALLHALTGVGMMALRTVLKTFIQVIDKTEYRRTAIALARESLSPLMGRAVVCDELGKSLRRGVWQVQ